MKAFTKWKLKTVINLIRLGEKHGATHDLEEIIRKAFHMKRRDVPGFIMRLRIAAAETGITELLRLIPSEEEIEKIMK
ncbi:MAG: hypothetical protein QW734_11290 [Candidatus Bathyarchaeia archaeon]